MEPAVSLRNLVKTFGDYRAVDGLSIDVPAGEVFGLLGQNGAGKTTTIRMIMDIIRPDSGEVRVLGGAVSDAKSRIGYLPEERGLYPKMKVIEMLEYLGSIKGKAPAAARKESVSWLERLELGAWKDKKVEELSKGMQQKVQFIATVLAAPQVLILDEPFSGMDPVNQNLLKDIMLDLNRSGSTIIFSTHQMETAERMCKEIALIHKGKLLLGGALATVKAGFGKNSVLLEYEGDGSFLGRLPGVAGIDEYGAASEIRLDKGADPQALLMAAAAKLRILKFEIVAPTLHNIFLETVGGANEPHAEKVAHA